VPDWYGPVLAVDDADVAFGLGCYHLAQRGAADELFAQGWFVRAVELGCVEMAWRVTVEQAEHGTAPGAAWWLRRAWEVQYPAGSGPVGVDARCMPIRFDERGVHLGQDFGVQVVSPEYDRAAAALAEAANRFSMVTADGREFTSEDELHQALSGEGSYDWRTYTPNYVSDVERHPDGPWIWVDCKDGVMPLMARTMVRILVEELGTAGVGAGRIGPAPR
jgi:hypothetical protein